MEILAALLLSKAAGDAFTGHGEELVDREQMECRRPVRARRREQPPVRAEVDPVDENVMTEEREQQLPVSGSQSFAVPSSLAVATRLPSGATATCCTPAVCPRSVTRSSPESKSHTVAVPSPLAVTNIPSGPKARPRMGALA